MCNPSPPLFFGLVMLTRERTHRRFSTGGEEAVPFVSSDADAPAGLQARMQMADSRSTDLEHQPEGLGDMFIGDKPFANFWTNYSSCPALQPRIDDGPAAVASCAAHHHPPPVPCWRRLTMQYTRWSKHGFESSDMSCICCKTAQLFVCHC